MTAQEKRKIYESKNREKINAYAREYRAKNKEKLREWDRLRWDSKKETQLAYFKEYNKVNKEKNKNRKLVYHYGISLEEYNMMLAKQNHVCALCSKPFTTTGAQKPVVDHCHTTGLVRGILHTNCNVAIGFFNENIDMLLKAAEYLTPPLKVDKRTV